MNTNEKFYSDRFDNIISQTNQSPKLEPMKEAIRIKFNSNIKSSFFGVPKNSSKYVELLSEYNKEVSKEIHYLEVQFIDYKRSLNTIIDEKYKRTQDYFNKLTEEQKKKLLIYKNNITLYRGYTSEGISYESGASEQIYEIMHKLCVDEQEVELPISDILTSFTTNKKAAWYFAGGVAELDGFIIEVEVPLSWIFDSYLTNDNLNQELEYQGEEITYEKDEDIEEYSDEYEMITDTEDDVLVIIKSPIIVNLNNVQYIRLRDETLIDYID